MVVRLRLLVMIAPDLDLLDSPLDPGLTVIEASAGTGKTYSISHLVPRLLIEGALPDLSRLLIVTFTKDAARELAERVRRVLSRLARPADAAELAGTDAQDIAALRARLAALTGPAGEAARRRVARALVDLDLLSVSTIHSYCQRILQQEGALCGLPVPPEVVTDDEAILDPILRRYWLRGLTADPALAALAISHGWSLANARAFVQTRRRVAGAASEPPPPPFSDASKRLAELAEALRSPAPARSAEMAAQAVVRWKKGGPDTSESAAALIRAVARADVNEPAFWSALTAAARLPDQTNRQGKDNKNAADALARETWFEPARELQRLAERMEWAWHHHLADLALPDLAATLAERRLVTQDGLIGTLHRALHRDDAEGAVMAARLAARLAERHHVALIDESQDTDPRQFAIFRRVFLSPAHVRRLILVGDPKQAIYGFRGADLATYLAARDSARAVYTLRKTRRSPQALVEVVNTLFARPLALHHAGLHFAPSVSALPYDEQLFVNGDAAPRLCVWTAQPGDDRFTAQSRRVPEISARIATVVAGLLNQGAELVRRDPTTGLECSRRRVATDDFAVLVSTHAQAEAMATALARRAIPAVMDSGADVFASDEARELHLVLSAVLEPRRSRLRRRALATRLLGLDAADLARAENDTQAADWARVFTDWKKLWENGGLARLLTALDRPVFNPEGAEGVSLRLAAQPLTGERRVTNLRQLTDLLLDASRNQAPAPDELTRWLGRQIARASDRCDVEEHQLRLASDRPAVRVVTMHKAKGLEYPLVFCPYLADSLKRPDGHRILPPERVHAPGEHATLLHLGLLDDQARAAREARLLAADLEERLRLAYVALTRARVALWTCAYRGSSRLDLGGPLDWLLRSDAEVAAHPRYDESWAETVRAGGCDRLADCLHGLHPEITAIPPPEPDEHPLRAAPAAPSASPPELNPPCARPAPSVPAAWIVTSFSALVRENHAHGAPAPQGIQAAPATPTVPATAFFHQPGGADIGTVVHDWIETWDFAPLPDAAADTPLARQISGTALATPDLWSDVLHELFTTLREVRLPGLAAEPLHRLCAEAHASEWHFHLPIAGRLNIAALADCFERHARPEHRAYAERLRRLPDAAVSGLLQGFIDRLVRRDETWGVIDWKTNRLGDHLDDYTPDALLRCAMDSHYLLQAHLYLVALRRHLHDAAHAKIAGAWLVFLRAIAPGSTRGVLHIDPPDELLNALDALFSTPKRGL